MTEAARFDEAKRYVVGGKGLTKVAVSDHQSHVVEDSQFWAGEKPWQHRALCGASIAGTPVSLRRLTCKKCRRAVEELGHLREAKRPFDRFRTRLWTGKEPDPSSISDPEQFTPEKRAEIRARTAAGRAVRKAKEEAERAAAAPRWRRPLTPKELKQRSEAGKASAAKRVREPPVRPDVVVDRKTAWERASKAAPSPPPQPHKEPAAAVPGDVVRYEGGDRPNQLATVVRNYPARFGPDKLLVHPHGADHLEEIRHPNVTEVQPARDNGERERRLRTARTVAHGARADVQSIEYPEDDPERRLAEEHARQADEALRGLGRKIPDIDPDQLAQREEPPPGPPPTVMPEPEDIGFGRVRVEGYGTMTRDEYEELRDEALSYRPERAPKRGAFEGEFNAVWDEEPANEAHPRHLLPGDEVMFHRPAEPHRLEAQGVRVAGSGAGTHEYGVVLGHNREANTLRVWSPERGDVMFVPHAHVSHVLHSDRPTRNAKVNWIATRGGTGWHYPAAAARASDELRTALSGERGAHDRLVDEDGNEDWFRSPSWIFYRQDRLHGRSHHWPNVGIDSSDYKGGAIWRSGGIEPFVQRTTDEGVLEEAAPPREERDEARLREARRSRRQPEAERDGIPRIGFGTSELPGEKAYEPTLKALKNGYRHIDTAAYYKNEEHVGRALKRSGVPRDDVHLTTKVWTDKFGDVAGSLDDSLKKLGVDHVDLLHAHWPKTQWTRSTSGDQSREDLAKLMRALQVARQSGKAKRIGVSNFPRELVTMAHDIVPLDAIQVEGHPHLYQPSLMDAATQRGIHVTLYAPLSSGRGALADPVVQDVAKREGITPAQTALAWVLNVADSTPPRSVDDSHQRENLQARPDMLSPTSLRELSQNALIRHRRYFNSPDSAPNWDWGGNYAKG